jgi:hypothetical protein
MVTLRNPVARWARDRIVEALASHDAAQDRLLRQAGQLSLGYRQSPIVGEHRAGMIEARLGAREAEPPGLRDWMDFGAGPRPGDRAPDARHQGGRRLFELLRGTHHTLLLFDGAQATEAGYEKLDAIASAMDRRLGALVRTHVVVPGAERPSKLDASRSVVLDTEGDLHRAYGATSECLYLVRPDGYVGFRSQPADGAALDRYLDAIFTV